MYATPNEVEDYARLIVELLDDEPKREEMSVFARARIDDELAWKHQSENYVAVYDRLLRGAGSSPDDKRAALARTA